MSSTARLSLGARPRMRVVKLRLTYKAFSPVTGWVRAIGCSAEGNLPSRESASFVPYRPLYTWADSWSAVLLSRNSCIGADSESHAAYIDANRESPPYGGTRCIHNA